MATSKSISNPVDTSRPDVPMVQNASTRNITVEVSGSRFCIVPSLFKHIENLPWKERKNKPPKLYANPDVFESVLQYFLSSKLPEPTSLSSRKAKNLIEFVSPLEQVAVKPLVDYLQTFVDKSSTEKTSFMRRGFPTISTPFSPLKPKSSKATKPSHADITPKQSGSRASSAKSKKESSRKGSSNPDVFRRNNPTDSGTNAPLPVTSSIPTHIEHPVTISATSIISVCSMDESSVSKLSIQSSPSLVKTQPPVTQNENTVPVVSTASSVVSANHQMQNQNLFQNYHKQNALTFQFEGTNTATMNQTRSNPNSGFSVRSHVQPQNPFDTPSIYSHTIQKENPFDIPLVSNNTTFPTMVQSLETNFNDQYRQQHHTQPIVKPNDPVPFTQTHNFMIDVNSNQNKQSRDDIPIDPSNTHKPRAATKILRTVLGGNEKKSTPGINGGRNLFRKQEKMTHAEWCASASEYIV
eukprot:CAMPEP_0116096312 /NCGR_PEP_ID=MMETSP0327-20121206/10117_1 /TAXON_ID=44447 /ORGANISM="Pseudo-nitzschia delicatissima, Strain B596" /LENGTH=466 /DNA_ID=CAMNT_0003588013 /DNA_START=117 /DNA_END=1517 /DNA_ORIENTATION=-